MDKIVVAKRETDSIRNMLVHIKKRETNDNMEIRAGYAVTTANDVNGLRGSKRIPKQIDLLVGLTMYLPKMSACEVAFLLRKETI